MYGNEFVEAVFDRVEDSVTRYNGYLEHWDVINEMIDQGSDSHKYYIEHSGDKQIRTKIFNKAKDISPDTMLFLNDYGVVDDRYNRLELYQEQIRELLENGTPIDGIGLQVMHYKSKYLSLGQI